MASLFLATDRRNQRLALPVLLTLAWSCGSPIPSKARPTAGHTIVAFGDSLVEGRGASPGHDFSAVLANRLGLPIINAGRSGDTTGGALRRLDRDVLSADPRVVIVLLGGNDFLRRVPVGETFENLGTIVERIRSQGAAVLLVGVSVGLLGDPYAAHYEALAQKHAAILVPDVLDGIIGWPHLMADAIHPNEQGYLRIADKLEPVLQELLAGE